LPRLESQASSFSHLGTTWKNKRMDMGRTPAFAALRAAFIVEAS
jgi:hypothetical protein